MTVHYDCTLGMNGGEVRLAGRSWPLSAEEATYIAENHYRLDAAVADVLRKRGIIASPVSAAVVEG